MILAIYRSIWKYFQYGKFPTEICSLSQYCADEPDDHAGVNEIINQITGVTDRRVRPVKARAAAAVGAALKEKESPRALELIMHQHVLITCQQRGIATRLPQSRAAPALVR